MVKYVYFTRTAPESRDFLEDLNHQRWGFTHHPRFTPEPWTFDNVEYEANTQGI